MGILGIDYGKKWIGVAISYGNLGRPLVQLANREAIPRLKQICQREGIELVVIGLPEGKLQEKIKLFGKKISQILNLKVIYWDETLTSHDAEVILRGKSPKIKDAQKHKLAASIMLESYLEAVLK